MRGYDATPWADRVSRPALRPAALVAVPGARVRPVGNGGELFVHHEDVRRGEPGWAPRPADAARDGELWSCSRGWPRCSTGAARSASCCARPSGERIVAKAAERSVTITGEPAELVLHGFGRDAVRVEIDGDPADVAALGSASRGV